MRCGAPSDDMLMRAVAAGDRSAFTEITRRHRNWVRSIMTAYVRDRDQAEDLTQEVFCRVFRSVERYDAHGSFTAWLKRIAINLARDFIKSRGRVTFISVEEIEDLPNEEPCFDPVAALEADHLREELRSAMQALPDEQRLALVMHYFGGMSAQDIAWAMKCPLGTVRSRIFNGLRRVRQTLTAQWDDQQGGPEQ